MNPHNDKSQSGLGCQNDNLPVVFTTPAVNISYLKKGDIFEAVRATRYGTETLYGVADMDGHRVSENYGHAVGSTTWDDPQKNYINVKWNHIDYPTENRWREPNHTVYERDGWRIFVTPEVYRRIGNVIRNSREAQELAAKTEAVQSAERELDQAMAAVERARAELAKIKH